MGSPIIISRLANLLFSAQRGGYPSLDERDLQSFFSRENIDITFYGKSERDIWKRIAESVGESEIKHLRKSIASLKNESSQHWLETSRHLLVWKHYFQNNRILLQRAIREIEKLCGISYFSTAHIPIYLISDSTTKYKEINAWYSWTSNDIFIVIEIPFTLKKPGGLFPLSVLTHECFHLALKRNRTLARTLEMVAAQNSALFKASLKEDMPPRMFLEELLLSSFVPEGFLSEQYFNIAIKRFSRKPKDLLDWRRCVAFKIKEVAEQYIHNSQQIDKRYLNCIVDIIKQNSK